MKMWKEQQQQFLRKTNVIATTTIEKNLRNNKNNY